MSASSHVEPSWKIVPITSDLRNEMLGDALRERENHVREERIVIDNQRPEPYHAAEDQTLRPLDCGMLLSDDNIELTTDAGCFCQGDVALCPERRRLTLWGHCSSGRERGGAAANDNPHTLIFRYVNLPYDIDPGKVTAKCKGHILTINMPRRMTA